MRLLRWLIKHSKWVLNQRGVFGIDDAILWSTIIGTGVPLLQNLFGGGDDESEFRGTTIPAEYKPTYQTAPVEPPKLATAPLPTYDWAESLLSRGAGYLGGTLSDISAGNVPWYLKSLAENIQAPAMSNLRDTYFGTTEQPGVAQLAGEGAAGRNLPAGAARQSGILSAAKGYGTAATDIQSKLNQLMYGSTADIAKALPSWLSSYGQIRPPTANQWYSPTTSQWTQNAVYGYTNPQQTSTGGLESLGAYLPYLMAGNTTAANTAGIFGDLTDINYNPYNVYSSESYDFLNDWDLSDWSMYNMAPTAEQYGFGDFLS